MTRPGGLSWQSARSRCKGRSCCWASCPPGSRSPWPPPPGGSGCWSLCWPRRRRTRPLSWSRACQSGACCCPFHRWGRIQQYALKEKQDLDIKFVESVFVRGWPVWNLLKLVKINQLVVSYNQLVGASNQLVVGYNQLVVRSETKVSISQK